jgi:hypothetical protein
VERIIELASETTVLHAMPTRRGTTVRSRTGSAPRVSRFRRTTSGLLRWLCNTAWNWRHVIPISKRSRI